MGRIGGSGGFSQMVGLCVIALLIGLAIVWLTRTPSETRLIARWAEVYAQDTGNPVTDCYARPADVETLRLYVICRPARGETVVFLLNNRGRHMPLPSLEKIVAQQAEE